MIGENISHNSSVRTLCEGVLGGRSKALLSKIRRVIVVSSEKPNTYRTYIMDPSIQQ